MYRGITVLFTGLSGAGKSTIAKELFTMLAKQHIPVEILDGDEIRESLCRDLGFSRKDREENLARVMFVAKTLTKHGIICLVPMIAPYKDCRDKAKQMMIDNFLEIYVAAPLDTVIERDVKGLYQKALSGEITAFTGIDDPYEEPMSPDLTIHTDQCDVQQAAQTVYKLLQEKIQT